MQQHLLRLYARANAAGLLEPRWAKRAFLEAYFAYKRYIEDPLHGLVSSRPDLFAGGHILDIGANVGYTTALFCGVVEPPFRVISFEPESSNFDLLQLVVSRRRLGGRALVERAAVGRQPGEMLLWVNAAHHADHRVLTDALRSTLERDGALRSEPVKMVSVDGYLDERGLAPVSFVKMDVQGYEPEVCAGMEGTLKRHPDAVVAFEHAPAETRELGFEPEGALRFFEERGYRLYRLERGRPLLALRRGDRSGGGKRNYFDVVASRRQLA
jgi:FkbM family methyltransferase